MDAQENTVGRKTKSGGRSRGKILLVSVFFRHVYAGHRLSAEFKWYTEAHGITPRPPWGGYLKPPAMRVVLDCLSERMACPISPVNQPTGYAFDTAKVWESAQRFLLENTAFAAWRRDTPRFTSFRWRLRLLFC